MNTLDFPWLEKYQKNAEELKNRLTQSLYDAHMASTCLHGTQIDIVDAERISQMARHTEKSLIRIAEHIWGVHLNVQASGMKDLYQEFLLSLNQSPILDDDRVVGRKQLKSIHLAKTLTQDILQLAVIWNGFHTNMRYLRLSKIDSEVMRLDAIRLNIDYYIYQLQCSISSYKEYFKNHRTKVAQHLANSSTGVVTQWNKVVDPQKGSFANILVRHPTVKRTSFKSFTICIQTLLSSDSDIEHDIPFRCKSLKMVLDLESSCQMALTKHAEPSITGAEATGQGSHDASAGNPSKTTTEIEGTITISALKCVTLGMRVSKSIEREEVHGVVVDGSIRYYPLAKGGSTSTRAQWRVKEDKDQKDGLVMVETHVDIDVEPFSGFEIVAHLSIHADFVYKPKTMCILPSRREIPMEATFQRHLNLALLSEPELLNTDTL
ncbi:hypothetical protein BJ165DRAFT_1121111 [Panaeolus papilionaceus]|nr:hypothetical protein BJ165DRAFT_1121111 [Panaeolus papilionaceus]